MGRKFYYYFVGFSLLLFMATLMLLPFLPTNPFTRAQTSPDIRMRVSLNNNEQGKEITVTASDVLNVNLINLKPGKTYVLLFGPPSAITKGGAPNQTIEAKIDPPKSTSCVPISTYNMPDVFEQGLTEGGLSRSCTAASDVAVTYNIAIKPNAVACGPLNSPDTACEIHLRESGSSKDIVGMVKVGTGATSSKSAPNTTGGETLTLDKSNVSLGEKINVTLRMPYNSSAPPTYRLTIDPDKTEALEIRTQPQADLKQMQCQATSVEDGNDANPWENYGGGCTSNVFTATINTASLGYSPSNRTSFEYALVLTGNGPEKRVKFTVNNMLKLELRGSPATSGQGTTKLDVEEDVPVDITAIGCSFNENKSPGTSNDPPEVKFEFFTETEGYACFDGGGTCANLPTDQNVYKSESRPATLNEKNVWSATLKDSWNINSATTHNYDVDGDGIARVGVRATCPGSTQDVEGRIAVHATGVPSIAIDDTSIQEYYDKGIKGFESVPIINKGKEITYSVYGLRPGENSNDDLFRIFDRSNCFYIELFKDGKRLKPPENYPYKGDPDCNQGDKGDIVLTLDRPAYAWHIFNGTDEDDYSQLLLCNGPIESTFRPAPSDTSYSCDKFGNGGYELKLYEVRGSGSIKAGCLTNPKLSGCSGTSNGFSFGHVEDTLVSSTNFQIGNAASNASIPPCRVAEVKTPDPNAPDKLTPVQDVPVFDSIAEFEAYFASHPDYIMTRCLEVTTAVGPFSTDPAGFITTLLGFLLSISGGIALLLLIRAAYQVVASKGDPEKLQEARERLTSTIVGLLFIIFSLVILEVIGVDILRIPGLCRSGDTECIQQGSFVDPSDVPNSEKE